MQFNWADRLRVFATLMMITVHVSGPISEHYAPYDSLWWWTANLWDSLARPAVPLFVMLSGWLLFRKEYEIGAFFKKRIVRVVVPGVLWGIGYLVFTHCWDGSPATLGEAGLMLFEGPVHYHLWFIYLIIGLYAAYPFIAPWVRGASEREFCIFFAIVAVATLGYKFCDVLLGIQFGVYLDFFSNQIGYFVLGYYLGEKKVVAGSRLLFLSLALIALGTAATALGTYFMGRGTGVFHPYFYDYLTPNVAAGAIGWFLLFRHFLNERPLSPLETDFAGASYGIYLCHVLVLYVLNYDLITHSRWHPMLDIPLTVFLCAFEAFVLIFLLQKTRLGKWLA